MIYKNLGEFDIAYLVNLKHFCTIDIDINDKGGWLFT